MILCFCCVPFLFQKILPSFIIWTGMTRPSLKWCNQPAHISLHQHNIPRPASHSRTWPYSLIFPSISSYLNCLHAVPISFHHVSVLYVLGYYHDMHFFDSTFLPLFLKKCIFLGIVLLYIFSFISHLIPTSTSLPLFFLHGTNFSGPYLFHRLFIIFV